MSDAKAKHVGFQPMKMHKNLVIHFLEVHPEDLPLISPEWIGTAQELIDALKADPREWFVGGELQDEPATT